MKDKKCKCSHLKSEHNKSFLKNKFCNSCQCEEYLSFDKPNKWDHASFIYGCFMVGLVVFLLGSVLYWINSLPDEILNEPFEITLGGMMSIIFALILLAGWIIITIVLDNHIFDYFRIKNRRSFK